MKVLHNSPHRVAGNIHFEKTVSEKVLSELVCEIKQHHPERWVDLHARPAGDDGTHDLVFHYILKDGEKKTQRKAVNRLLQYLRDKLGTKPLKPGHAKPVPRGVGHWNIGTVTILA